MNKATKTVSRFAFPDAPADPIDPTNPDTVPTGAVCLENGQLRAESYATPPVHRGCHGCENDPAAYVREGFCTFCGARTPPHRIGEN